MGYRSNVYIMCEENAYNMLKKAWEEHDFKPDLIKQADVQDDIPMYFVEWEWVKWYDHVYDEVDAIMDALFDAIRIDNDGEKDGYGIEFIRIGEDMTDIEEHGSDTAIDRFCDFYAYSCVNIPSVFESAA